MEIARAQAIIEEVAEARRKWGKHVSLADFNKDDLLDAIVVLDEHVKAVLSDEATASRDEITLLRRQLGAAKARETKLREDLNEARKYVEFNGDGDLIEGE